MIKFSSVQKKDIPVLAKIYARAFNQQWEHWTPAKSKAIITYRCSKKIKIKVLYKDAIVWAFFSDIKPLYMGNVLNDGDVFIDPDFQNMWIGRWLFVYGIQYAKKKFDIVWWDFYTFKNSYQYKRYKSMGFAASNKRVLMSGKIDDVLKKIKQKYMK
jgi:GNAT superfamily N-acetyltransferase